MCVLQVPRELLKSLLICASAQSTITNKSRLKLLHKREEILQQIFFSVRESSIPLCQQSGRYEQFLEGVITEAFLFIMESSVTVHCRKSDIEKVKHASVNASMAYKDISGYDISFDVQGSIADDAYVFLSDNLSSQSQTTFFVYRSQGGVKFVSGNGRITLDNTLEERLRLLEDKVRRPIALHSYTPENFADAARNSV
jgi:V-type H+-transporting ATPase subunit E